MKKNKVELWMNFTGKRNRLSPAPYLKKRERKIKRKSGRIIEISRKKGYERETRGEKSPRSSLFLFPKIEIKLVRFKEKSGKKTEKKIEKIGGGRTSLFQMGRKGDVGMRVGAGGRKEFIRNLQKL